MAILVNDSNRYRIRGLLTERSIKFYDGTYELDSDGFRDEDGVYHPFDSDDPEARPPTPFPPLSPRGAEDINTSTTIDVHHEQSLQPSKIVSITHESLTSSDTVQGQAGVQVGIAWSPTSSLSEIPSSISDWSVHDLDETSIYPKNATLERRNASVTDEDIDDSKSQSEGRNKKSRKNSSIALANSHNRKSDTQTNALLTLGQINPKSLTESVKQNHPDKRAKSLETGSRNPSSTGPEPTRGSSADSGIAGIKVKRCSARRTKTAKK